MGLIYSIITLVFGPLLGIILYIKFKKDSQHFISFTVLFSGAFLLGVALFCLLPELFDNIKMAGVWVAIGFFAQIIIEKFTGGIDHGHIHHHQLPKNIIFLYFGLLLHALFEGYSAGLNFNEENNQFSGMVVGISIHEIPAAFSLAILLFQKIKNKYTIGILLLVYILSTSIGFSSGYFIHKENLISDEVSFAITGVIAGTFLHISTIVVYEQSLWKKEGLKKWVFIVAGMLVSYLACLIG